MKERIIDGAIYVIYCTCWLYLILLIGSENGMV